jgi:hypothetical protein
VGESRAVDFPIWSASPRDTCLLESFTDLLNDVNRGNDSVHGITFVRAPRHDVGVVRIVGPTGTVELGDSATPQAEVRNYGSVPEDFQVRFRIGGAYNQVRSVTQLAPGQSDTLSFLEWLAQSVGTFPVMCTTNLADGDPSNNVKRDSVMVIAVGAEEGGNPLRIPATFVLQGALPNPFASRTMISYGLPTDGAVSLGIYNSSGVVIRQFRTLKQAPGFYSLAWDGRDAAGRTIARGIYFCRLQAGNAELNTKLVKLE